MPTARVPGGLKTAPTAAPLSTTSVMMMLLVLILPSAVHGDQAIMYGSTGVLIVSTGRDWNGAYNFCRNAKLGVAGMLAKAEGGIRGVLGGAGGCWIGLTNAGGWRWADGSNIGQSHWAPNEPSGDGGCGHHFGDLSWNDENCAGGKCHVCTYPFSSTTCSNAQYCNSRASATAVTSTGSDFDCTCTCQSQYAGTRCERCSGSRTDYPTCRLCTTAADCNGHASAAAPGAGQTGCACTCSTGYTGPTCSSCAAGYIGYPNCVQCSNAAHCSGNAVSVAPNLAQTTCVCNCRAGFDGTSCNTCQIGYARYPACAFCTNSSDCSSNADNVTSDRVRCLCGCRDLYRGDRCESCRPGLLRFPRCETPTLTLTASRSSTASLTATTSETTTASVSTSESVSASDSLSPSISDSSTVSPSVSSTPSVSQSGGTPSGSATRSTSESGSSSVSASDSATASDSESTTPSRSTSSSASASDTGSASDSLGSVSASRTLVKPVLDDPWVAAPSIVNVRNLTAHGQLVLIHSVDLGRVIPIVGAVDCVTVVVLPPAFGNGTGRTFAEVAAVWNFTTSRPHFNHTRRALDFATGRGLFNRTFVNESGIIHLEINPLNATELEADEELKGGLISLHTWRGQLNVHPHCVGRNDGHNNTVNTTANVTFYWMLDAPPVQPSVIAELGKVGAVAAAVISPSAGLGVMRAQLFLQDVCNPALVGQRLDWLKHPLQIPLGNSKLRYHFAAAVLTPLLVFGFIGLHTLIAVFYRAAAGVGRLVVAMVLVRVPHAAVGLYVITLQIVFEAVFVVLAASGEVLELSLAAWTCLVGLVGSAAILYLGLRRYWHAKYVPIERELATYRERMAEGRWQRRLRFVKMALLERGAWVATDGSVVEPHDAGPLNQAVYVAFFMPLYMDFNERNPCYLIAEISVTILISAFSGLSDGMGCDFAKPIILVLAVACGGLLIWRRPHCVPADSVQQVTLAVMQLAIAIMQVASFALGAEATDSEDDVLSITITWAAFAIQLLCFVRGAYEVMRLVYRVGKGYILRQKKPAVTSLEDGGSAKEGDENEQRPAMDMDAALLERLLNARAAPLPTAVVNRSLIQTAAEFKHHDDVDSGTRKDDLISDLFDDDDADRKSSASKRGDVDDQLFDDDDADQDGAVPPPQFEDDDDEEADLLTGAARPKKAAVVAVPWRNRRRNTGPPRRLLPASTAEAFLLASQGSSDGTWQGASLSFATAAGGSFGINMDGGGGAMRAAAAAAPAKQPLDLDALLDALDDDDDDDGDERNGVGSVDTMALFLTRAAPKKSEHQDSDNASRREQCVDAKKSDVDDDLDSLLQLPNSTHECDNEGSAAAPSVVVVGSDDSPAKSGGSSSSDDAAAATARVADVDAVIDELDDLLDALPADATPAAAAAGTAPTAAPAVDQPSPPTHDQSLSLATALLDTAAVDGGEAQGRRPSTAIDIGISNRFAPASPLQLQQQPAAKKSSHVRQPHGATPAAASDRASKKGARSRKKGHHK